MNFKLNQNEAQFILQVLGQLPTQTGALPLFKNWEAQFASQMPKDEPQQPNEVEIVPE